MSWIFAVYVEYCTYLDVPPPETNMTVEKHQFFRCISYYFNGDFPGFRHGIFEGVLLFLEVQLFNTPRSPLKGDMLNKYPLYKVYMGLIIKGTIPRVPAFFLW